MLIREPTTKVGAKREDAAAIPEELAAWHIPQKVEYGVREIYVDLLNFSARHLVPGGRLAFWLPVNRYGRCVIKLSVCEQYSAVLIRYRLPRLQGHRFL